MQIRICFAWARPRSRSSKVRRGNNSMSATFLEARPSDSDWIGWFKRELAPTRARKIRTAILVGAAVLSVIISMALQVPEVAVTAFIIFFISQPTKQGTILTGLLGFIGATVGIGGSLLLYKFTYGYPELRIPSMAIALFLGMWSSRILVLGPLGFIM